MSEILQTLRQKLRQIAEQEGLTAAPVSVRAATLTPEQAIGHPEHDDYPLVKGREKMIEAVVDGGRGHAFTDMAGDWEGTVSEILDMPLANNYRRALFIATLNAVLAARQGLAGTVHCRDGDPVACAEKLPEFALEKGLGVNVALVGFQPRMAQMLSRRVDLRILDLDEVNHGKMVGKAEVWPAERLAEAAEAADWLLVSGSTIVNDTLQEILDLGKPVVVFGVTVAGTAKLLGLKRFCPLGK